MVPFRCRDCRWFDHQHSSLEDVPDNFGYCRKHKPVVFAKDAKYYGGWPLVDLLDLCGEFRGEE